MHHPGTKPPILLRAAVLLLLAAATCALAQQGGRRPAPAPPADTPLTRCAAANRDALAEIGQAVEAARTRHLMNPLVVTRLQALQASLARVRETLPRSSRTLPECEAAGQAIAAEKDRLQRVAGPDPEVAECIAAGQKMHAAVMLGLEALQRSGRAPDPAGLQASAARMGEIGAALGKEGALMSDCRALDAQIAQERGQIERWLAAMPVGEAAAAPVAVVAPPAAAASVPAASPSPPAPAPAPAVSPEACRDSQARSYNELAQDFATVAQAGPLTPEKVALFQALSERLTRLRALIADRNAPGWDCAGVTQGLAAVRDELRPLMPRAR